MTSSPFCSSSIHLFPLTVPNKMFSFPQDFLFVQETTKMKRLMSVLIPRNSHKTKPKISFSLSLSLYSCLSLHKSISSLRNNTTPPPPPPLPFPLPPPLSWTRAQFFLTTLIKTSTSVQSRHRWDEIAFNRITFFRTS